MKKTFLTQSRKGRICLSIILCTMICLSFTLDSDSLEKTGLNKRAAELSILNNLIGVQKHEPIDISVEEEGSVVYKELKAFKIPAIKNVKDLIGGNNIPIAEEVCQFTEQYLNSEQFKKDYASVREQAKPVSEPVRMDENAIASLKNNVKEIENSIKAMKAANMPKSVIEQSQKGLEEMQKLIVENADPTPNLTKWKELYPENPKLIIKKRALEYLEIEKTVDYQAELVSKGNKKVFANPVYESKPLRWKAIYRAGKDVNQVFVKYANIWSK